ncbi:MAG: LPS export ABC transporter permease LptF [Betaproteobacteria bacterium]|jgi:lipopolysaccharide export system permease protein|nr:LPS export ABC transporter permease LptF [Betaproteobacteria bacterium]NBX96774.1 LPS export ABC transporter permease LptF [Betaproteobacteria bacterium]
MLFDTSIRRELARSFGASLVVLMTIVLTLGLVRTVGAAAQGRVSAQDVLLLLGFSGISQLAPLLALSMFIAVVHTLGRVWRDSEMVIWNSAGLPLQRFMRPVARMSWLVCLAVAALVLFVTPWMNRQAAEVMLRYAERSDLSRVTPGVFQLSRDGRSVFFIERDRDDTQEVPASARSVFIHTQNADRETLTTAMSGRLVAQADGRYLALTQGHRLDRQVDSAQSSQASFAHALVRIGDAANTSRADVTPKTMTTWDLLQWFSPEAQGELAWRMGLALASANLLVLGVVLSVSNPRKPSQWGVLFALLSFIVYFNLINLSQSWVQSQRMPLWTGVLGLHGGVALLAWTMLWWRSQAMGWRLAGLLRINRTGSPAAIAQGSKP